MQRRFWQSRTLTFAALGASALALSGCGSKGEIGSNFHNVLTNTARSILAARAYDRGIVAAQRQDQHGADTALREYMQLQGSQADLTQLAASFVEQGSQYDTQAMKEQEGSAAQTDLMDKSADAYRSAMTLSNGKFTSDDPDLLNALGYFLADRGTSPADFREGERLTRLALATDAQQARQNAGRINSNSLAIAHATIRDSLAWALYRQEKYDAAEREQMTALKAWRAAMIALSASDDKAEAELTYHLAAIYAAHDRPTLARAGFKRALELRPIYPAALRGLVALEPSVQT